MSQGAIMTIGRLLPAFAEELEALVAASTQPALASQIRELPIVARCLCGQSNCAHFYTEQPQAGSYPPDHFTLILDATAGLVILDIIGRRIVAVEVLDRPDVKARLDAHLPQHS